MTRPSPPTAITKFVGEAQAKKYSASTESELAEFSCEVESSWSQTNGTTTVTATTVGKYVGEGRPPGFAKYSVTSESELAKSSDEAESSLSKAYGTSSASFSSKYVGGVRPPGIAKCSATTESEPAESSDEEASDDTGASLVQSKCHVQHNRNSSRKACL